MCGLFGVISPNGYSINVAPHLRLAAEQRGRDYTGFAFVWDDCGHVIRSGDYRADMKPWEADSDWDLGPEYRQTLIANLRAEPTTEVVDGPEGVQPFKVGKWTIVHNGIIANDKKLCNDFGFKPPTPIDSWVIAALLDRGAPIWEPNVIGQWLYERLVGSFSVLIMHDDHPGEIVTVNNYKPLYWGGTSRGTVIIASTPEVVTTVGRQNLNKDFVAFAKAIPPYSSAIFRSGVQPTVFPLGPRDRSPHKVLAVCSGGLDSTVAATWAKRNGYDVDLLHFHYGCRAELNEFHAIDQIAKYLEAGVVKVDITSLFKIIGGSRLTSTKEKVADGEAGAEFAHEWVPARNLVMMSIATAIAESKGYDCLTLGANLEESGAYPDNEPEFWRLFGDLLPYATGPNKIIRLATPVGTLMKHEIVALGHTLGAPMHLTWSCYEGGAKHCGQCGPCYMRKTAYAMAGFTDPMEYK